MPQVEVEIGGRSFEVACQPGEEAFLRAAASLLDAEARALSSQIGRMPETRMLLMAGLMLADKTAALEERLREAEALAEELQAALAAPRAPVEVPVEVPVVPPEVSRLLADIATEAEALARSVATLSRDEAEAPSPA
jgi:cell division protein ZapA